jgi:hypothetical protein
MNLITVNQSKTNLVQDENDLLADSHNILNRWKNNVSQLWNVQGVNDVRQTEMHTTEPLLSEPICFKVESATEKLKQYKEIEYRKDKHRSSVRGK